MFVLIIGLVSVDLIIACPPSPGTNIYLDNSIVVDFDKIKSIGNEGENYIVDDSSLIIRSLSSPEKIAIKLSKELIMISPFSQDFFESREIADTIDWIDLVSKELSFLSDNNILTGLTNEDIDDIADCSTPSSSITPTPEEKNIVLKKCGNWNRISECFYTTTKQGKIEVCPDCSSLLFLDRIPLKPIEHSKEIQIQDSKKYSPFLSTILIVFIIILVVGFIFVYQGVKNAKKQL